MTYYAVTIDEEVVVSDGASALATYEGQIYSLVQQLNSNTWIELFELDLGIFNIATMYFHGYTQVGPIYWQDQTYEPWPLQIEGLESTGTGQQPSPMFRVSNLGQDADGNVVTGVISALCEAYDDLLGAKVVVHQTFGRYLDAENFGGHNPAADSSQELPQQVLYIKQKTSELPDVVEFELTGLLSFNGFMLPGRQIIPNICPWLWLGGYRGTYCAYAGSNYYTVNNEVTTDPALDQCNGTLKACKLRFGENNELRFGGFPSAGNTSMGGT